MSEFVKGTVFQMGNNNYIVLNVLEQDSYEYLLVVPVNDIDGKWENVASIDELDIYSSKLAVLTHNKTTDEYKFETDKSILTSIFKNLLDVQ